jgi:hypothetical protein
MFAPMSPLAERTRIQNERQIAESRMASRSLPGVNVLTVLRNAINNRPHESQRQPHPVMQLCAGEQA